MNRQAEALRSWMAQRQPQRQVRGPAKWLLWPVGDESDPDEVAYHLRVAFRNRSRRIELNCVQIGSSDRETPVGLERIPCPSSLDDFGAVVLVVPPDQSTITHAYRIFKELLLLSRKPRYGLVLSGSSSRWDLDKLGAHLDRLAESHSGVSWSFLGHVSHKDDAESGHRSPHLHGIDAFADLGPENGMSEERARAF